MSLVASSLRIVGRAARRAYTSDAAYQAGMLVAMALVVLTLTVGVVQRAPRQGPPLAEPVELCWTFDPLCT